jgi:ribokinase
MIGCVGDDPFGAELTAGLQKVGADTTHVSTSAESATGVALIVVDDEGNNTIVVSSGANRRLRPEDIRAAEQTIAAADLILMQLEIPMPVVETVARLARTHGVTTVLDPAPYRPLAPHLLELIDVVVPNETEAAALVGAEPAGPEGAVRVGDALLAAGVGATIVTRGSFGATLVTAAGANHFPAHRIDAVDSTAAGDAFVGAFAVSLVEGGTTDDSVRFGNAAGAVAATRRGAQSSLPTRAEVEAMLAAGNYRTDAS